VNDRMPPEWAAELGDCFRVLSGSVYGAAYSVTRERELAAELVQEAFQAAAKNWAELRTWSDRRRRGWLRQVTANIAIDGFRRNTTVRDKQGEVWERYRPREFDTAEQALSSIALQRCWEVIERMPQRQHLAALLYWRHGMKTGDIAKVLGITEGAVTSQLSVAREKLRLALGPELPFELGQPEGGA